MGRAERLRTLARGSLQFIARQGERHVLVMLGFMGNFISYCMRLTISMAIIQMVRHKVSNETAPDTCPQEGNISVYAQSRRYTEGDFDWDSATEAQVLAAFYYGYICTQIPAGWLAGFYSAKKLYGFGIGATALFTLLVPVAAYASPAALMVVRVLQGVSQGISYPVLSTMFGRWAPPSERTRMLALCGAGAQVGTVIVLPISSALGLAYGWESIFYVFGGLGMLFPLVWFTFAYDSPEEHPRITAEEKSYIISSIGAPAMGSTAPKIPWIRVLKSPPVWAIVVVWWCGDWGFYTLLSDLPLWLNGNLHFSVKSNGGIAALPYLFLALIVCGFAHVADYLVKREIITISALRKITTVAGTFVPALFLIWVSNAGCDKTVAVVLVVLAVSTSGFASLGFRINFNDLSPSYAGLLVAIANTVSTTTGFLGPVVTGYFIREENGGHTKTNWRNIFSISVGLYGFGAIFYAIFGSAEMQSWDHRSDKFESNRVEPESMVTDAEAGLTQKPRRKSSIPAWIPPETEVTEGVKQVLEKRRRSSIPPWVPPEGEVAEVFLDRGRRRSMLQEALTVIVEPTTPLNNSNPDERTDAVV